MRKLRQILFLLLAINVFALADSGIAVYPVTDLVEILFSYSRMDFEHDIFQILISNTLDIVIEVEDKKVKEIQEITEYDSELKKGNYKKII